MKLLIVKTSSMGDVIHALPAVTDALAHRKDLDIGWMVEKPFAPIVALHPGIRRIHQTEARLWRRSPFSTVTRAARRQLRDAVRAEAYDLVIDAQGLLKSALLARMAGAPIAGLDFASAREGAATWFYAERHAVARDRHAVTRLRLLFAAVLGYAPDLARTDFGIAAPKAAKGDGETAFLLHGTNWPTKQWTLEHWIETAHGLTARGLTPVATWSDDEERRFAEAIGTSVPTARIVPRTGLGEVAAMIGQARLAVGVDTGLMHLASAFGVPTVALYIASRPGLTGPVGNHALALSATGAGEGRVSRRAAPGDARSITPAAVLAAADTLLERKA